MLRGTRVADAYVRITADGSSINEDIADSFDGIDYDRFGEKAGEGLKNRLNDFEVDTDAMLGKVHGAFENDERIRNAISKQLATAFDEGRLEILFDRIGKEAGISFGDGMDRALRKTVLSQLEPMLLNEFMRGGGELQSLITSRDFGSGDMDLTSYDMDKIVNAVKVAKKKIEAEREKDAAERERTEKAYTKFLLDEQKQRELAAKAESAMLIRQARETAEERAKYLRDLTDLFDEQEANEQRIANLKKYAALAEQTLGKIRLDPDFSPARVRELQSRLRTLMTEEDDFRIRLSAEVDPGAIADLQSELDKRSVKIEALLDDANFQKKLNAMHETALRMDTQRNERLARMAEQRARQMSRLDQQAARAASLAERDALRKQLNFAGSVGRMFGKGARNNFFNLVGSAVGGLASILEAGTNAAIRFGAGFSAGMAQAGQGASMMARLSGGLSRGLTTMAGSTTALVVALPLAAAGLVAMLTVASALVSVLGALAGLLTAVASTIASGLAGAAIAGGAAFAALAATIGLVTLGFKNMSIATRKAIKEDLGPVKTMVAGLGEIVSRNMFADTSGWATNLKAALVGLIPLAQTVGIAMRTAIGTFTTALSGPGVQMFVATLSTQIVPMMDNLALSAGAALNGLLAVFSGVLPYVTSFTTTLSGLAVQFATWSSSVRGQNAISDFVARALTSLQSLWGAVRAVSGFIGAVLFSSSAQSAGGTIFDSIADTFDRLKAKVNDGSLQKWFNESIDFGKKLWVAILGLSDAFIALYDSGVLQIVGDIFEGIGVIMDGLAPVIDGVVRGIGEDLTRSIGLLVGSMKLAAGPMGSFIDGLTWIGEKLGFIDKNTNFGSRLLSGGLGDIRAAFTNGSASKGVRGSGGMDLGGSLSKWFNGLGVKRPDARGSNWLADIRRQMDLNMSSIDELMSSGRAAKAGKKWAKAQKKAVKAVKEYKNPYKWWALSLIRDSNSAAYQIGEAFRTANTNVNNALRDASRSIDAKAVRSSMKSLYDQMHSSAKQMTQSSQQTLNSAAQELANANSRPEAIRALRKVRKAQEEMRKSVFAARRLNSLGRELRAQGASSGRRVAALLAGERINNATLADYALARARMAKRLESANKKLEAATKLRTDYRKQVADSIKAYGALTTAEARTIDGVQQRLTAGDITKNLQERLAKIRAFNNNLRVLLSRGLSNAAYKQIVDAGVENGSDYARALVAGGTAAVQQVNSLTSQINAAANSLGKQSSNRLYQAGVQVAAGLVAGLKSQSAQLDAAAISLGNRIARGIRNSLGINSPARVPMGDMDHVGDGVAIGLDRQGKKVASASERLSSLISFTPAQAQAQANMRALAAMAPVSGNSVTNDITVITPTKDPVAVAKETLNEMTGRFL